jgi:hypothetical protein
MGSITVLFYATLLITSFLLTLVIIGLKNLIVFVARKTFKLGKRDAYAGPTAHFDQKKLGRNLKVASSTWGTQPHATPANLAKTHPAVPGNTPWGWPESGHETHESHPKSAMANGASLSAYLARKNEKQQPAADWKRNIGRPVRDDSSSLAGTTYKPSQDAISKYGIDKDDDRPRGW